ncbi:MAG: hypothetical protein WDA07_13960 [Leucobacter sp.]
MKVSPRQQQLLLDLQDLDTAIARLHRRRNTLPERAELDALTGESATVREQFMGAQRDLDALQADIDRIEADVETVRQRRERDEQLIAVSTSSKEAQSLQNELETLARRQADLEDRELELMERHEAAQAVFDAAERAFNAVDGRRSGLEDAISVAERKVDAEIETQQEERAGVAAELQRDVLGLYEELRARLGVGAARLRGNVSEASNMALTPAELSGINAAAPDELVFCPGTGAILVRVIEE